MFQVLAASAAFPVDRDRTQHNLVLPRLLSVDPFAQHFHSLSGRAVDGPADGRQAAHHSLPKGVKARDRHVPRNTDAVLVETFDDAQRHVVVGADHRVRDFPAVVKDPFRGVPAADPCPFPVDHKTFIQLQPVFAHRFAAGFQPGLGNVRVGRSADKGDFSCSVFVDHMLRQFTDADGVVKDNAYSPFLGHINGNMGLSVLLQRLEHFRYLAIGHIVAHRGQHGDHAVKLVQVRQVVNHAFADFAVGGNRHVHVSLAVKNADVHIVLYAGGNKAGGKFLLIFPVDTGDKNGDTLTGHGTVSSLSDLMRCMDKVIIPFFVRSGKYTSG